MANGSTFLRNLSDDTINAIAEAYRTGVPQAQAAALAGVTQFALSRWIKLGSDELDRLGEDPDAEPEDTDRTRNAIKLVKAIKEAEGKFVQEQLLLIRRAATQGHVKRRTTTTKRDGTQTTEEVLGEPQWTAAAWLLERRHNQQFGRQIRQEISGPDGGPIQVDESAEARISEKLDAYYQGVADGRSLASEATESDEKAVGSGSETSP